VYDELTGHRVEIEGFAKVKDAGLAP